MATSSSNQRTEFFQQLKKVCVPLSQLALVPKDKVVDSKEVLRLLDSLINLWTLQAGRDETVLDDKLADYVFFPLSHLLRGRDRYSVRVTETVIRLLRLLIQHGWRAKASPQLFQQLLIFLTFAIGGVPGQPKKDVPEETVIEGFRTLAALVGIAQPSHLSAPPSEPGPRNETIQALDLSVTAMLDGITDGPIPAIQLEAAQCLRAVFATIKQHAVLAQVLPGTVSALAKVLSPPQANQTQRRVLQRCLEVLQLVLVTVLGDIRVRSILRELQSAGETDSNVAVETQNPSASGLLTPSWLKATASQLKIALSAVLKLRAHESEDVQSALHGFCIALLDECHSSLANCQLILVETAMMLEDPDTTPSRLQTSLQDLASIHPELGNSIKSALYNWVTGLPRVMQSSDERVRQLAVRSIRRGSKLAAALHMDSFTLNDALGDSLRDGIVMLVKGSKEPKIVDDAAADVLTSSGDLVRSGTELATYRPVLLGQEGQKATRTEIGSLISNIGPAAQQVQVATTMLSHVRDSEGVERIASLWLAFELLKATYAQSSELDEMLDLSSLGESRQQEEAFRELYDYSVSVLAAHSDSAEADWRLEAIALEVAAFAASRLKADFRPELIDVLYPVTTFLGSPVPQLRAHAITTLNMVAASCGYGSVSDLIVDNADYMVNAISLRLNTFDITPASIRVLTMVIRLTGPRLIPYLDDVVAAIFAALDNYHGYPAFVEGLFSVLSEVVTQGVKSDAKGGSEVERNNPDDKPKTPTYALLSQIVSLTQHHLTSPAPRLRKSLLELVATAGPALAPDENAFLPLVHAVWPVVLARLRDPEPFVAAAACRALAALCRAAGDFLSTRFRSEWSGGPGSLAAWFRKTKEEAVARRRTVRTVRGCGWWRARRPPPGGGGGGGGLGRFAQAAQVWEAAVGLLTALVGHVRVEDDMFDDILGLVVDVLPQHGELREALETINSDAVWLALYERGMVPGRAAPVVEGLDFRFASAEGGRAVQVGGG
ncbi:hypothetical protein VTH06DRAFT_3636 [Thermothelomyces fergusii]